MNGCEYVTLKGGLRLPLRALQVVWSLRARGAHIYLDDDDGRITVTPGAVLTDFDKRVIQHYRVDVIDALVYESSNPADA
jgi:hypothetical protein